MFSEMICHPFTENGYLLHIVQGRRKTFRGGAAKSKEAAKWPKILSTLRTVTPCKHVYVHRKYDGIDRAHS